MADALFPRATRALARVRTARPLLRHDGADRAGELEDVVTALQPAEQRLGRRISPTVYTTEELQRRRKAGQPFLTKILAGKHVVLL